jgi:hypothetical protein
MARRTSCITGCLLAAVLLTGCGPTETAFSGPAGIQVHSPRSLASIHRVVLVELPADWRQPRTAADMTEALFRAIQARQRFQVDVVSREDPVCRDLPLDLFGPLSMQDLHDLREGLGCDAVLLGRLSDVRPHPQMQIGLHLRLLDLRDGRLVWGGNHIWDSTEKATQVRMERYFESEMRSGYEPADWRVLMMSPRAYQKFVAFEAAGTLPVWPDSAAAAPAG